MLHKILIFWQLVWAFYIIILIDQPNYFSDLYPTEISAKSFSTIRRFKDRNIWDGERSFRVSERNSVNHRRRMEIPLRRRKTIASASRAWLRRCRTKGIRAKQRRGRPRDAPIPSLRASTLLPHAQRTVASGNSDSVNLPGALHFREV